MGNRAQNNNRIDSKSNKFKVNAKWELIILLINLS
jgi:hypothetical protein